MVRAEHVHVDDDRSLLLGDGPGYRLRSGRNLTACRHPALALALTSSNALAVFRVYSIQ